MAKCWRDEPNLRPSFEKLRNKLRKMENQHKVELKSLQGNSLSLLFFFRVNRFKKIKAPSKAKQSIIYMHDQSGTFS